MGAVPASGDLVTVKLLATCGGEPTINDLSFQIVNPTASWPSQVAQVLNDLDTAIGIYGPALWSAQRSTAYNLYGAQVVDVRPGTSPLGEAACAAPGGAADDVMPPNDSLCVTLRTDVKGRTGRGRMYLNGYPEGSANGGYWEAAAQDAASALATALLTNFGQDGALPNMLWGVISRFEFKVKREVPAFTPINSFTVHNEVRSLRRRAVGVRISRHRLIA
jgi:hypothetical protein